MIVRNLLLIYIVVNNLKVWGRDFSFRYEIKIVDRALHREISVMDSSFDSKEKFRLNVTLHFRILPLLERNVVEFSFKSLARLYWTFRCYRHPLRFSTRRWILGIILLPIISKVRLLRDAMSWLPYGWRIISTELNAVPLSELSTTFSRHTAH